MTIHERIKQLYESTADDLRYGIGVLDVPDRGLVPLIHIHYADWSLEKLDRVRGSFHGGLILVSGQRASGSCDLYLATREKITVQAERGGHTSILKAPAWDARLTEVDGQVVQRFEAARDRRRGFLLLVLAGEWEFLTAVDAAAGTAEVGECLRCRTVPSNDRHVG